MSDSVDYQAYRKAIEHIKKLRDFLDSDLGSLPCESRQRNLPEETWETAMYLRDITDEFLKDHILED